MKAVVTLSKKFFPQHPRKGEETLFREKVLSGSKRHTCRSNYEYWKEKIDRLKNVGGVLSVRQWSANPYRSPQEIVTDIPAELVGVQKLILYREKEVTEHHSEGTPEPVEYECTNNNPYGLKEYRDGCTQNCNECDYYQPIKK